VVNQELRLTRHIYQLCGLSVAGAEPPILSEPFSSLSLNDLLRALFFVAGQQRGLSAATSRHLTAAGKSQNFHGILTKAYSVFENWPVNYFEFLDRRRIQERKVSRTYQRMKSALYEAFGSFYSGLHNVLSGSQFDFMRRAFIDYIVLSQSGNGVSNFSAVIEPFRSQYLLKSDVRRLLGVDYRWINYQIRTRQVRVMVRSKGKKRLIFIDVADVLKLRPTHFIDLES
jgi:hypothetical protein